MSKNKHVITKAVEDKGYSVGYLQYEPIGGNVEMIGREGGWVVRVDQGEELIDYLHGYNISGILGKISELSPCIGTSEDD